MKFFASLALASLAVAAPAVQKRAPTPLGVKLELQGNSKVKAVITNNGKKDLKVLKSGTFLDTAAVEKAQVYSGDTTVDFEGIRVRIDTDALNDAAFEHIPAGKSVEVDFDVAEMHDLSAGGNFSILTSGALSFADENSNELIGSVPFESNTVEAEVNGEEASAARAAFHEKRTIVQSDCTDSKLSITQTALSNCARLASNAQAAASTGSADKMVEYFKASDSNTRNTVSGVFSRVASECGSTDSGVSRYYCSDVYGACSSGVLAYTLPSGSYMAYCDLYFQQLPALTTGCHSQDQATTNLHEATHLTQIKGTSDYGGYGYNFVQSLSAAQNLNHADTYALFANAIALSC
ncbi:Fc.00g043970.m01.CDS01 [Cosmosporella sp. VM-42]